MIFYFSGTGNSAWVARKLAQLTGDQTFDIAAEAEMPKVQDEGQIGFVFPVYAWGAPEPVLTFAKKVKRSDHAFTFGVSTCGGEAGHAMKRFSGSYPLDSCYSVKMPNNYIVGVDTEREDVIKEKLCRARREIEDMAQEILRREKVYRVHEGSLAGLKSTLANVGFNRFARSAKPFSATGACISCGQCAARCPAGAISMQGGRPTWKAQCFQCMRCINECPSQAIEYGKATQGRRRYTIGAWLPQEEQV